MSDVGVDAISPILKQKSQLFNLKVILLFKTIVFVYRVLLLLYHLLTIMHIYIQVVYREQQHKCPEVV